MICDKDNNCCNSKWGKYSVIGLALFLVFMLISFTTIVEDPSQQAINKVAEVGGWDARDIVFEAGTLKVLMNYARVGIKVRVKHADGSSTRVNAVVKRYPFYGYEISCYAEGDNGICVGDLGRTKISS